MEQESPVPQPNDVQAGLHEGGSSGRGSSPCLVRSKLPDDA